jgi:phenylacetate-coenzyme A ligase PaaK-like adenylate-forming protein
VIRLRTSDISRVVSRERCACGRTHVRIGRITGRIDDMLIVKGVQFWPRQVEQVLMSIPGVKSNYQIIIEDRDGVKDVRINVEAEEGVTALSSRKDSKKRSASAQRRRLQTRRPPPPGGQKPSACSTKKSLTAIDSYQVLVAYLRFPCGAP